MTQKEKQLLLIDLCGRLLYGVKIQTWYGEIITSDLNTFPYSTEEMDKEGMWDQLNNFKPYLRPMSSMTEEEKRYLLEELGFDEDLENGELNDFGSYVYRSVNVLLLFDWLNEHHLDWRGLIPMGLALEAKEGMYEFGK